MVTYRFTYHSRGGLPHAGVPGVEGFNSKVRDALEPLLQKKLCINQ